MVVKNKVLYQKIYDYLDILIVNPKSELNYSNTLELMIAVMLSAQCTDKRVNIITSSLFKKHRTASDYANLSVEQLEKEISSCNYYHNKAKNIINACKTLVEKYNGQVPSNYNDLVSLSGVGNKTANVILAVGFDKSALAVDTHILRVSNRLGLVNTNNPTICERMLKEIYQDRDYVKLHHLLLLFGRYYCKARAPMCDNCELKNECAFYIKEK